MHNAHQDLDIEFHLLTTIPVTMVCIVGSLKGSFLAKRHSYVIQYPVENEFWVVGQSDGPRDLCEDPILRWFISDVPTIEMLVNPRVSPRTEWVGELYSVELGSAKTTASHKWFALDLIQVIYIVIEKFDSICLQFVYHYMSLPQQKHVVSLIFEVWIGYSTEEFSSRLGTTVKDSPSCLMRK